MNSFSRLLVAGGAGFIGSHIVDELLERGKEVTVLDSFYTGRQENLRQWKDNPRLNLVQGDIRDRRTVKQALIGVDAVINEAAVVSIPRSLEDPILTNEVNVGGTLNLLESGLNSGVKRFVQASSASVYGNTNMLPINEDSATNPISPYGVAELAAENYAKAFFYSYGLDTICLRYFNVYGPRQIFSPYSGATTIFLDQLYKGRRPVIFGDGEQTRDMVYVEDIVEANMLALEARIGIGESFNIASGKPHTVNELVLALKMAMNKRFLEPMHENPRKGDIKHSHADIAKATTTLGYKPRFSLEKGVAELVKWYCSTGQGTNFMSKQ